MSLLYKHLIIIKPDFFSFSANRGSTRSGTPDEHDPNDIKWFYFWNLPINLIIIPFEKVGSTEIIISSSDTIITVFTPINNVS